MSDPDDLPEEDPGDDPAAEPGMDQGRARVRKSPMAFRTISEVADELHIPQHVLRFWETKFPQVKPLKRGGGRRYYRPDDLILLRRISDLLYIQGYTIKGVQRLLREGPARLDDEALVPGEAVGGDTPEDDMDELPPASDEEPPRMTREDEAERRPARVEPPGEPRAGEAERLRAALREALAALESLRAMLG